MTTWHDPPEVQPLSDLSWRRIERDLFTKLDQPPQSSPVLPVPARAWRWRPALAVTGALACAGLVLGLALGQGDGPTESPVAESPVASNSSRIVTADAPTHMTFGRASVEIAPNSVLWVHTGERHGVTVIVEAGRIDCAVAPSSERPPFVVNASDVRVEVVGTRFSVSRDGDAVRVEVTRGAVAVYHRGDSIAVEAGEDWSTEGESPTTVQAGDEVTAPSPANLEEPARERRSSRARSKARKPTLSAKQRYDAAAKLEASDPAAAIAMYRKLAADGGAWAANALYAQARLELERGNQRVARRLLKKYLRRYPRGNNAADARALLDQ